LEFDNLLLSASHEELDGQLAARLDVNMQNVKLKDGWIHRHVSLGRNIYLHANDGNGWKEIFRGKVYRWLTSPDEEFRVEFVAYDALYPLTQSKEQKYFKKGETAVSSIKTLAAKWGIPLGRVDGPHTKLADKLYPLTSRIGDIFAD